MRKINYLLGIVFLFGAISLQSCSDEPSYVEPSTRSGIDFMVTLNYLWDSDVLAIDWRSTYIEDFDAYQVFYRPYPPSPYPYKVLGTIDKNSWYVFNVSYPGGGLYSIRAIKYPSHSGAEPIVLGSSDEYPFLRQYPVGM